MGSQKGGGEQEGAVDTSGEYTWMCTDVWL